MNKKTIACVALFMIFSSILGSLSSVYAETTKTDTTTSSSEVNKQSAESTTNIKKEEKQTESSGISKSETKKQVDEPSISSAEQKEPVVTRALMAEESTLPDAVQPSVLPTRQTLRFNEGSKIDSIVVSSGIKNAVKLDNNGKETADIIRNQYQIPYGSTNSKITVIYKEAATEIATNRKLDLKLTISDFYFKKKDTYMSQYPQVLIYDNVDQNIRLFNLYAVKETMEFTYNDNAAEPYAGEFYVTTGSLNFQRLTEGYGDGAPYPSANYTGASRYEFSTPEKNDKFIQAYIPNDSEISSKPQFLSGTPVLGSEDKSPGFKGELTQGFMGPADKSEVGFENDNVPETVTKFGITYRVKNGFSFYIGTSGNSQYIDHSGKSHIEPWAGIQLERDKDGNWIKKGGIDDLNNHAIVKFDTAIPDFKLQLNINKIDNFTSKGLKDVEFKLTEEHNSETSKVVQSSQEGLLSFTDLIPGRTYILEETKPLSDYVSSGLKWTIKVPKINPKTPMSAFQTEPRDIQIWDDKGNSIPLDIQTKLGGQFKQGSLNKTDDFLINPSGTDPFNYQYTFTVRNIRKGMLPQTGGSGNTFYYTVAVVSVVAALSVYVWTIYRSRKEWN